MSKARNPRPQSNYFQTTVQKILSSSSRSRLAAFLILLALAATAVYTVTSRAQRQAPKATAGRVQEEKSEREREREREKRAAQSKASSGGKVLVESQLFVEVDNGSEAAEEAEEAREEAEEREAALRANLTPQQEADFRAGQEERLKNYKAQFKVDRNPQMSRLVKARTFTGDLRALPQTRPDQRVRVEHEIAPPFFVGGEAPIGSGVPEIGPAIPAPTPNTTFLGLDFANWGAGRPPDTVGDVGPTYYIQSVNTSIGIYRKSDNVRVAAFTYDTFMSQGNFGNLCDTKNFGDPVILYDTFEDRWVITDFAFTIDGAGNVNSSAAYQCFAVSKTGDPVSGGWNYYSINSTTLLGDYPKFGIWPDGLYMSANMFGFPASAGFSVARLWAFNKHQMYAGDTNVQIVTFDAPAGEFSLLPSNARLQAGTPPTGTPNLFSVVWQFSNGYSVYKFHVDWNNTSLSTLTGPFITIIPTYNSPPSTVPSQGGNNNETLGPRLQMQNQYTNRAGVESLWNAQTVRGSVAAQSAVRYYQLNVTGGTIPGTITQSATHNPDAHNRYMPSLAVDRAGNMAMGYSASSATLFPAIRYAGRLATDPINSLPQTETSMIEGTGSQNSSTRWGDYSAMSLDPDGCTFWYTTEYYITTGNNWQTRIGKFKFPTCTPFGGGGTVQGIVTATDTGDPIVGATVKLGSRVLLTDANGAYSFTNIPAGTYPYITASYPGYVTQTVNNVVVTDGATTTQNFALVRAPAAACLVDTSQADFSGGVLTNLDLTTSPGNVTLSNAPALDQSNTNITGNGFTISTANWGGQTFVAGVSGPLKSADLALFCSGCTGTTPNLTLSVRATNASSVPTGADLASATIPGFNSGSGSYRTATFTTPATLTAGTKYALVIRPVSNPSVGSYAYLVSAAASAYANGSEVFSSNSGTSWATDVDDLGFHTFMDAGYRSSGNLISSLKDANPAVGVTAKWTTISWNATTPASTNITFQVAVSNNPAGPFNFVGPDGTASTFFTNGASLSQFNGNRYLKYKAVFTTSNSTVTPTLADVTICYANTQATTLVVAPANGTYGGTTTLSATLTDGVNPLSGKTVKFKLNGANFAGNTAVTNASGVATISNAPLTGINVGVYPTGVFASFAGDATYSPSTASNSLTVVKANTSTSVTSNNNPSAGGEPVTFTATVTSGGGTPTGQVDFKDGGSTIGSGTLNGSGQATYTTSSLSQGSHSITAEYVGDSNFNNSASSAITQTVTESLSTCANVAAAVYGSTASASSTFGPGYPPGGAIDGNHKGNGWGTGVGWNDNTAGTFPDNLTINLGTSRQLNEIYVYSLQDNYLNPSEPTESMTFTLYGLVDFEVQVPDGMGGWVDVPGGNITGNNKVRRRVIFASAVTTDQIRIVVNNTPDIWSRVVEVEAFSCNAPPPPTPTPTPTPCTTNVAAASYGGSASASSTISPNYPASGVIDGNRAATNWGTGTGWNDATAGAYPDSVVLNFGVNQAISEVDVYSLQDNYGSPIEPTDTTTFTFYGLTDFQVQIPNGVGGWVDVPGGHVTGNNLVKRKVVLATPVVTDQIRILVNSSADGVYSRIAEVEAFSCSAVPGPTPTPTPTPCTTNVAAGSYGATASASSTVSPSYPASGAIDGNHTGAGWGTGVGWNDATAGAYPDNLVINLNATQSISEVDVYSLQDNYASPIEPTNTTTFTFYGLTNFQVQIPNGVGGWVDVPGGNIVGNNLVKRKVVFASPVVTDQIRILVNASADGVYSRIVEVEAFSCTPVVVSAPTKRSGQSADIVLTGHGQSPVNPARLPLPLRLLSPSLNRAWLR